MDEIKDVFTKYDSRVATNLTSNTINSVLEDIKTEIKLLPVYAAKFTDGFAIHVNRKDVLAIIDKYMKEGD